jgi:hypothetical protein
MRMRLYIVGALALSASSASADHDHAVDHGGTSAFGAGVTMVAASFDTMFYVGNYQGVQPALTWANERFAAGASAALYRIERNGASYYGFGDVVVHGQAVLVRGEHVRAGLVVGFAAPVGDDVHGLGMGHPMVMPAAYGTYGDERFAVTATAGYSRAIAGTSDHDHGMWPIVEPMNMSELSWSAAGNYVITSELHAGARISGGVPIGDGDNRIVGAARAIWLSGRFTTAAELQAGIAGDPFTVRGVVSTAMSF